MYSNFDFFANARAGNDIFRLVLIQNSQTLDQPAVHKIESDFRTTVLEPLYWNMDPSLSSWGLALATSLNHQFYIATVLPHKQIVQL